MKRVLILAFLIGALSACDTGVKQLGPTEIAVKFRMLPRIVGGGLADSVEKPGQVVIVLPWEQLYRFDTRIQNLEWGAKGSGTRREREDWVQSRALDGNEVSLSVRLQFHISRKESDVLKLVQNVASSNKKVEEIVSTAARADMRTYMNKLKTAQFFRNEDKFRGEAEVREALEKRLGKLGIIIDSVNLQEHRFERVLPDGTVDRRYQKRINEVQALDQETKREELRKKTVIADKQREKNNMQATVNRRVEEAIGYRNQATLKGDAYLESKENEAKGILATGKAEVEGIQEQINALAGPGGAAILRLEIAKQMLSHDPKFIVMEGKGGGAGISVKKVDTNELLQQIGVIEAMKDESGSGEAHKQISDQGKKP